MPAYGIGTAHDFVDLTLPSRSNPLDPESPHNICKVRRPGVDGLIKAGLLDNLDSLTAIVQLEHIPNATGRGKVAQTDVELSQAAKELIKDPSRFDDIFNTMDRVVCYVVVEPPVQMPPEPGQQLDPNKILITDVDLDDRLFIFQYVMGGVRSLESFRSGTGAIVGAMAPESDVPLPAIKPSKRKKSA